MTWNINKYVWLIAPYICINHDTDESRAHDENIEKNPYL